MAPLQIFQSRLEQAAAALSQCSPAELESIAELETSILSDMASKFRDAFTEVEKSDLVARVFKINWPNEGLRSRIVTSLIQIDAPPKPRNERRSMQDFRQFVDYFTEVEWQTHRLKSGNHNSVRQLVLTVLVNRCGGRCLSEKTKRLAVTFLAHLLHDGTAKELVA